MEMTTQTQKIVHKAINNNKVNDITNNNYTHEFNGGKGEDLPRAETLT